MARAPTIAKAGEGFPLTYQEEKVIPGDHPCFDGHFPGQPVVPASLLLEEAERTLATWHPGTAVQGFQNVKFLQTLAPDQPFSIQMEHTGDGRFGFECRSQGTLIAHGKLLSHP